MTRPTKKYNPKTMVLVLKLALLAILFWSGIRPVFTDLFEGERLPEKLPVTDYEHNETTPGDSLSKKVSLLYPTDWNRKKR